MTRPEKYILQGTWLAVWLLCLMSAWPSRAASGGEDRQWNSAKQWLSQGAWKDAESKFSDFTNKYPGSIHAAEAVMYQAQARYHLAESKTWNDAAGKTWSYNDVVSLLTSQFDRAGSLAGRYLYEIGAAQFANGDYRNAAVTYDQLAAGYDEFRAEALFHEADCYDQARDTSRVISTLSGNSAFQQLVRTNAANEWVTRSLFLLAETQLAQDDATAALATVAALPAQSPGSELEWKVQYLLAHCNLAAHHADAALENGTNLLAAAQTNGAWLIPSEMTLGEIHLTLGQTDEAISNYEAVLNGDANTNLDRDEQNALRNVVGLELQSGRTDAATNFLNKFLKRFPDEQGSGDYQLQLGKLELWQYYGSLPTNLPALLADAEKNFEDVLQDTNSELEGEAEFNLGWSLWAEQKYPESSVAFSNAVRALPVGEDRAVALFKLGDTQYQLKDFDDAISNYQAMIDGYSYFAEVSNSLVEPAWYQILRAATEKPDRDLAIATNAMSRILTDFPNGTFGQPSVLLMGLAEKDPAASRATFEEFVKQWPDSPLRPDVDLAIAQTYYLSGDWTNAIDDYRTWISTYPGNSALPTADYNLGISMYQSHDDSNAFVVLSDFVGVYTNSELWPRAQFWIAKYLQSQGKLVPAEQSFAMVVASPQVDRDLKYQALMEEGLSAEARSSQSHDAAQDFSAIISDTNAPPRLQLAARAELAHFYTISATAGDLTPITQAIDTYQAVATNQIDPRLAAQAWMGIGDCYYQLAVAAPSNYLSASNAYATVIRESGATAGDRAEAELRIARVLEGLASSTAGSRERNDLLAAAVSHCRIVINGDYLGAGESNSLDQIAQAGFEAGSLLEQLGKWDEANRLYRHLQDVLSMPDIQRDLAKRIEYVRKQMGNGS
jgi:TolA-binding protein